MTSITFNNLQNSSPSKLDRRSVAAVRLRLYSNHISPRYQPKSGSFKNGGESHRERYIRSHGHLSLQSHIKPPAAQVFQDGFLFETLSCVFQFPEPYRKRCADSCAEAKFLLDHGLAASTASSSIEFLISNVSTLSN